LGVLDRIRARTKSWMQPVGNRGWWPIIREPHAGAWQQNVEWSPDTVLAFHAVYACVTLIASDIGKLWPRVMRQDADGIWSPVIDSKYNALLRVPNRYQNHIQFKEWWITSKLIRGNAYALKERNRDGDVVKLYLLDPCRVQVLVAPDGSIFYQLSQDNLTGIMDGGITVPASEIIHDRMNCLFHPLCGTSPIFACGAAANIGLTIQSNSSNFFGNGSNISGVLTAPGPISDSTAARAKTYWETEFTGQNAGKVAILGDGLKFEPMRMTSVDAQLIEQLKWTAEVVCSTFHVPPFKIGIGAMPTYQNAEVLNQIYYADCLQSLIEQFELCMDQGLGIGVAGTGESASIGIDLDLDGLLRMDSATQYKTLGEGVGAGIVSPNEARRKLDLPPTRGGSTPYMQQQNYSLSALYRRDIENIDKPDDVQSEAFNGAQVTALQGLIVGAATGMMPKETAAAAIAAAFPLLTPAQIEAMIGPIGAPALPPPAEPEDQVRGFLDLIKKGLTVDA
jgi:HK97 family phage portal protein